MKKIFTVSSFILLSALFLTGCYRRDAGYNEDYWLSKERGEVVYSDSYCNYYVVQTNNGYTVIRSYGSYKPFEGSIVYGDFSYRGTNDIYNRSSSVFISKLPTTAYCFEAQVLQLLLSFGKKSRDKSQKRFQKKRRDKK
jgi:hypothetical protein